MNKIRHKTCCIIEDLNVYPELTMEITPTVVWVVTPCYLVDVYQMFTSTTLHGLTSQDTVNFLFTYFHDTFPIFTQSSGLERHKLAWLASWMCSIRASVESVAIFTGLHAFSQTFQANSGLHPETGLPKRSLSHVVLKPLTTATVDKVSNDNHSSTMSFTHRYERRAYHDLN